MAPSTPETPSIPSFRLWRLWEGVFKLCSLSVAPFLVPYCIRCLIQIGEVFSNKRASGKSGSTYSFCSLQVWLAKEEGTWEMLAIKQLSKAQEGSDEASSNEVSLLNALSDQLYCPRLRGAFQDRNSSYIVMVSLFSVLLVQITNFMEWYMDTPRGNNFYLESLCSSGLHWRRHTSELPCRQSPSGGGPGILLLCQPHLRTTRHAHEGGHPWWYQTSECPHRPSRIPCPHWFWVVFPLSKRQGEHISGHWRLHGEKHPFQEYLDFFWAFCCHLCIVKSSTSFPLILLSVCLFDVTL